MFLFIVAYWLDMSFYCSGLLSDAIIKPTLCPVSSCSGQSALLHQVKGAQGSDEGSGEDSRDPRDKLHIWSASGQRWRLSQLIAGSKIEVVNQSCLLSLFILEDAKRQSIKEEQHDPGYEETCAHGSQQHTPQAFGVHPSTDTGL